MPEVLMIKNLQNNNILRCRFGKNNVNLGLINGKNMRGIAVPLKSVLEKSPAYDLFTKNAINSGFRQENIDLIELYISHRIAPSYLDELNKLTESQR